MRALSLALSVPLFLCSAPALADFIRVDLVGTVGSAWTMDPVEFPTEAMAIEVGDPITASYIYDDSNSWDGSAWDLELYAFEAQVGNFELSLGQGSVIAVSPYDYWLVVEYSGAAIDGYVPTRLVMYGYIYDSTPEVVPVPAPEDISYAFFLFEWPGIGTGEVDFIITSVSSQVVAPIPEPGEWLFMLSGLGVIAFMARRRNR